MTSKELYDKITSNEVLTLIAGPCVLESKEVAFRVAEFIARLVSDLPVLYIYKSSFEKANRSSVEGYRGPGLEKGLKILQEIKKEFGIPVLTDVHTEMQAPVVGQVVDIIQIPAFLSRQTSLLVEAGLTGAIVNIKKGQFMAPDDMEFAANKVSSSGNQKIMLTERGTFFGYHNLVVDMRNLIAMNSLGYPVIYDATHSVQLPSSGTGQSGGEPKYIEPLALAAMATGGLTGIFFEVHPNPKEAKSDASSMLNLSGFRDTMKKIIDIYKLTRNWKISHG